MLSYLEISVDNIPAVHVLKAKDDLWGIEAHVRLTEEPVVTEVVVQVATVHQVKDEAELVWRLECVGHADYKRASFLQKWRTKYIYETAWRENMSTQPRINSPISKLNVTQKIIV